MRSFNGGLDWVSVKTFLRPPTTAPLFPNLRKLGCKFTQDITLLQLPLPSLVELSVTFSRSGLNQDFLISLPDTSPKVLTLDIKLRGDTLDSLFSSCIRRLHNLQSLACQCVSLSGDTLMHLARMTALTTLELSLHTVSIPSDLSLVFSNLHVSFFFDTPEAFLQLLRQVQFPAVTTFEVDISHYELEVGEFSPILADLPKVITTHKLQELYFCAWQRLDGDDFDAFFFEDLQPCTAFSNLRVLELNVACRTYFTNDDILQLASAWPKLESLLINEGPGWKPDAGPCGITPGGLVQLLQLCPSLRTIALVVNTDDYTEVPASDVPASLGLTFPSLEIINVVDSPIEDESVRAMATFFCGISARTSANKFPLSQGYLGGIQ